MEAQYWGPKKIIKINDLIVFYTEALTFKKLLHQFGSREMMLSTQQSIAVDHTMSGDLGAIVGGVHGITNHSCALG